MTLRDPRLVSLKRYGTGKCWVGAQGDPQFHETVKEAFADSMRVEVSLDLLAFASALKAKGIPDEAAREFLGSASLNDEVFLDERSPA